MTWETTTGAAIGQALQVVGVRIHIDTIRIAATAMTQETRVTDGNETETEIDTVTGTGATRIEEGATSHLIDRDTEATMLDTLVFS